MMVEVKSDKITRIEVIITHAKTIQTFLEEYRKTYSYPASWGDHLKKFLRDSENILDNAIIGAYKKAVRTSNQKAKNNE